MLRVNRDFEVARVLQAKSHLNLATLGETFGMVAAEALAQVADSDFEGRGNFRFIEGDLPLSCVDFLDVQGVIANLKAIMAKYDEQSAWRSAPPINLVKRKSWVIITLFIAWH